ncbi:MAG: hypothetical protein LW884_06905 [Bacteroidetes bacterium]|jgi:hypothetical protein|nr:hypothetical protein [Bacteroidota bacterium]
MAINGYVGYIDAQGPWIKITGTRKSGMKVDIFIRENGYHGAFGRTIKIYKRLESYIKLYVEYQKN